MKNLHKNNPRRSRSLKASHSVSRSDLQGSVTSQTPPHLFLHLALHHAAFAVAPEWTAVTENIKDHKMKWVESSVHFHAQTFANCQNWAISKRGKRRRAKKHKEMWCLPYETHKFSFRLHYNEKCCGEERLLPSVRLLLQEPFGFRHEEYCAVWAVSHRANLSCDFSLPPLKFHSQDATGRQSQGGDAVWQLGVPY